MNWEQKVGNVGEIAGSVLDIVGTVFPPAAILAVAGTGITALAGAIGGIGQEIALTIAELGGDLILVDRPNSNYDMIKKTVLNNWAGFRKKNCLKWAGLNGVGSRRNCPKWGRF
jgi:hypothetical protein